tara:strand:- start:4555 stop:5733 length:1179 start_codon:yes stop_codon:yes gene_type:complete
MKDIENMIDKLVEKVLKEEVNVKVKNITESVKREIDEMEEYYEVAQNRKDTRKANKEESNENMGKMPEDRSQYNGRDSEVVGVYSNIDKQRKEMGEEICEECGEEICSCGTGEMGEGAKPDFLDLDGDGDKEESMKSAAKSKKKKKETKEAMGASSAGAYVGPLDVDESTGKKHTFKLTEDEMIELIERIVKEQKIEGLSSEKTAMKTTKKDNEDYIKSVTKKMKKYLNDADEGEYVADPTEFPKGNGDRKEDKMMYTASDGVEEYIEQIARSGGMENLEYDQIKPDEEWLDLNIMGSSETGNNPEWGNAVKTDTAAKVKDRMDKNILAKLKKQSYNKAPQPVTDYAGKKTHKNSMAGIEVNESKTESKKKIKVNEDINKMKNLISHNYRTQ